MTNQKLLDTMEELDVILMELNNLSSNKKEEQSLIDENISRLDLMEKELLGEISVSSKTRKMVQ